MIVATSTQGIWELLKHLYQQDKRDYVVGIGGSECSGKTYLSERMEAYAKGSEYQIFTFHLDAYLKYDRNRRKSQAKKYRGEDSMFFEIGDHPECFDFSALQNHIRFLLTEGTLPYIRRYNSVLGRVVQEPCTFRRTGKMIVLVEGIFALSEKLVQFYDTTLFVEASKEVLWQRFLKRHQERENSSYEEICDTFQEKTVPAFHKYIEPTRQNAQIIVDTSDDVVATVAESSQSAALERTGCVALRGNGVMGERGRPELLFRRAEIGNFNTSER